MRPGSQCIEFRQPTRISRASCPHTPRHAPPSVPAHICGTSIRQPNIGLAGRQSWSAACCHKLSLVAIIRSCRSHNRRACSLLFPQKMLDLAIYVGRADKVFVPMSLSEPESLSSESNSARSYTVKGTTFARDRAVCKSSLRCSKIQLRGLGNSGVRVRS